MRRCPSHDARLRCPRGRLGAEDRIRRGCRLLTASAQLPALGLPPLAALSSRFVLSSPQHQVSSISLCSSSSKRCRVADPIFPSAGTEAANQSTTSFCQTNQQHIISLLSPPSKQNSALRLLLFLFHDINICRRRVEVNGKLHGATACVDDKGLPRLWSAAGRSGAADRWTG